MTVTAILVAAGSGSRLGAEVPKAFVEVGGRTLLEHAAARFAGFPCVVVAPAGWLERARELVDAVVVEGGMTRQDSVDAGLQAVPGSVEAVLVHDVARPFVPAAVIDRVVRALQQADAVIPALAVTDTVKRVDADGVVLATLDRADLVAVQTPQGFRREVLVSAHARAVHCESTDDAALVEAAGGRVVVVDGDEAAFKITTPQHLALAEVIARG